MVRSHGLHMPTPGESRGADAADSHPRNPRVPARNDVAEDEVVAGWFGPLKPALVVGAVGLSSQPV